MMGDALVAIDAGLLAGEKETLVGDGVIAAIAGFMGAGVD
jgi:hypothetical protein